MNGFPSSWVDISQCDDRIEGEVFKLLGLVQIQGDFVDDRVFAIVGVDELFDDLALIGHGILPPLKRSLAKT